VKQALPFVAFLIFLALTGLIMAAKDRDRERLQKHNEELMEHNKRLWEQYRRLLETIGPAVPEI
jgi:hypothetical protein